MSRIIAIFGTTPRQRHAASIPLFLDTMSQRGFEIHIASEFADDLQRLGIRLPEGARIIDRPISGTTAALSLGGDGTFLRCAQWINHSGIPVIGVNTGHLGFLSVFAIDEADALADALDKNTLIAERREMLKIDAPDLPSGFWPYALNEVAILKEETSSMINIRTHIDGFYLTDYLVDGLVISTPTGSTGYNLAIGGPILQPTLASWVLSPIAPHTLTMRPLAVSSSSIITARAESRSSSFRVSLDGRSFPLPSGSLIRISKAPFTITTLRRSADNFASTLRNKLLWGRDNRYAD